MLLCYFHEGGLMDTGLYEDEEERGRHSSAMRNLVKDEGMDEEDITRLSRGTHGI